MLELKVFRFVDAKIWDIKAYKRQYCKQVLRPSGLCYEISCFKVLFCAFFAFLLHFLYLYSNHVFYYIYK